MTSRLVVNSVRHTGASADALTLDSSGGVTIPTKKLICPGTIIQVVSATKTDTASFAVASGAISHYTDSSLRVTITPTSASNTLHIMGHVVIGRELLNWVYVGIGKDGADFTQTIGDADGSRRRATVAATNNYTDIPYSLPFHVKVTPENTSERYYNLCFSHGSGSSRTLYLNRGSTDTNSVYYPRGISTITVMEIQA
jgi:hypothetical protein